MWGYRFHRFLGISFAVLACLGLMDRGQALATTYASPGFSMNRPLAASPSEESFQLAITAGSQSIPSAPPEQPAGNMSTPSAPPEQPTEKEAIVPKPEETNKLAITSGSQSTPSAPPEKPTEKAIVPKPEETKKKEVKKASKPKKKKVKAAQSKKSEAKKAQVKKPEKEEAGFIDTLKSLVGVGDASKENLEKASGKAPEKEEPGLLTKALKKLVGGDDDKNSDRKQARQNPLNPINVAPTVSSTQKQQDDPPQAKTAKTDTQTTLKGSFKKLIGVDAAKDKAEQASNTVVKTSKQEESGVTSVLKNILGGDDKKDPPAAGKPVGKEKPGTAKQAQAKTSEEPAVKRTSGQTRKYLGQNSEDEQLEKDRGGVKKGKNILKESFKTLVTDEINKEEEPVE